MTVTDLRGVRSEPVTARPAPGTRSRAVGYLLVRVSGVLLALLVLGHFAITHIVNDVAETGSAFVDARFGSVVWLLWDAAMLAAAFLHGGAGMWVVIEDYTLVESVRRRRHRLLTVTLTVLWLAGMLVIADAILT